MKGDYMSSDGYCYECGEPTDEPGPGALCAYHRDMAEGVIVGFADDKEEEES